MKDLYYKSCSHVLHLILSILTGGFWALVWLFCAVRVSRHNAMVKRVTDRERHEEQMKVLERIAAQGKAIPEGVVK